LGPRIQVVPRERASRATTAKISLIKAGLKVAPSANATGKAVAPFCMKPCTPSSRKNGGMCCRLRATTHSVSAFTNLAVSAGSR
jgi:hypothetical protein